MSYRIAGIAVHKKMLAVVVADVEVQGEYQFERIRYGSNPEPLRLLAAWPLPRGSLFVLEIPRALNHQDHKPSQDHEETAYPQGRFSPLI